MRQLVLLNAPNVVSLSRLVLAVCFIAWNNNHVRVALLLTAALTDALDGWLARRSHTATKSGALIDAIADRVFVLTAVAVLVADGFLSLGAALVLLSRDIATAIGFIVARIIPWLRQIAFKARFIGKVVTVLQFAMLIAVLDFPSLNTPLLLLIALTSAAAIADYTLMLWRNRGQG